MTEQAGYMNQPDLIEECVEAIDNASWMHAGSARKVMAVFRVLRDRGLITEQGLELIKQSGEAK